MIRLRWISSRSNWTASISPRMSSLLRPASFAGASFFGAKHQSKHTTDWSRRSPRRGGLIAGALGGRNIPTFGLAGASTAGAAPTERA